MSMMLQGSNQIATIPWLQRMPSSMWHHIDSTDLAVQTGHPDVADALAEGTPIVFKQIRSSFIALRCAEKFALFVARMKQRRKRPKKASVPTTSKTQKTRRKRCRHLLGVCPVMVRSHTHKHTPHGQDKLNGDDKALQAVDGRCSSSPPLSVQSCS